MKKCIISAIISILLMVGTAGLAFAQTAPPLSGFFVSINMQPAGPFDTAGLQGLIYNGQLTRNTLVWREGMVNWVPAGTVAELAPLFPATPPPLAAAPPPLHQPAPHAGQGEPWGGHPAVAGLVNTIFGIWSFTNDDFAGGLLTVGLQLGGAAVTAVAWNMFPRTWQMGQGWRRSTAGVVMAYAGNAMSVAGTVYGFFRGFTQYNTQMARARGFAEAINDNPLNNISVAAFPTSDGKRVVWGLNYSISF